MEDGVATTAREFQAACRSETHRPVNARVRIDSDILDWLKTTYPRDWQNEVNALLRFHMDTSQQREENFQPDTCDPGEMDQPPAMAWTL